MMRADYSKAEEFLASCGIRRQVAELHGVLTGQICAGGEGADLDLSLKILAFDESVPAVLNSLLDKLAADIRTRLQAGDYTFEPLLPGDDAPLMQRLAALADWCDGFIAGFAGAWVRDEAAMSAQVREVLDDFARIAQVDQEDSEAPDRENEVNYMEIVEYARMAAITVYLQNHPAVPALDGTETGEEPIH